MNEIFAIRMLETGPVRKQVLFGKRERRREKKEKA